MRRSRFKVAANIPVRRKLVATEAHVETLESSSNENVGSSKVTEVADEVASEQIKKVSGPQYDLLSNTQESQDINGIQEGREINQVDFDERADEEQIGLGSSALSTSSSPLPKAAFKKFKPILNFPKRAARLKTDQQETTDDITLAAKGEVVDGFLSNQPTEELGVPSVSTSATSQKSVVNPINQAVTSVSNIDVIKETESLSVQSSQAVNTPVVIALKSPARARFAKPVVTDAAVRRRSIHFSSASESEDEGRRQNRTRKLSEVSAVNLPSNQSTEVDNVDNSEGARTVFVPKKKAKANNFACKVAEAKREFRKKYAKQKPDRGDLKMIDLLYYNPRSAPLKPKARIEKDTAEEEKLEEEEVDNPGDVTNSPEDSTDTPVPQVKIGANGEIIIDERSLVIETTAVRKKREALENAVPFLEVRKKGSYYGKKRALKQWTAVETKCFYKALNCLGTDFTLIKALFPDRTRAELKNKFKREERCNSALVNRALGQPGPFNYKRLKQEFDEERARVQAEVKRIQQEKENRKTRLQKKLLFSEEVRKPVSVSGEIGNENKSVQMLMEFIGESSKRSKRPRRKIPAKNHSEDCLDSLTDDSSSDGVSKTREDNVKNKTSEQNIQETNEEKTSQKWKKTVFRVAKRGTNIATAPESVEKISSLENVQPTENISVDSYSTNINCDMAQEQNAFSNNLDSSCPQEEQNQCQQLYDTYSETVFTFPHVAPENQSYVNGDTGANEIYEQSNGNTYWSENPEAAFSGQLQFESGKNFLPDNCFTKEVVDVADNDPHTFPTPKGSAPIDEAVPNTTPSFQSAINFGNTSGIQYAIIESGVTPEQKKALMANLEPGSFVFISEGVPGESAQRRCSMEMVIEEIMPSGEKEVSTMPVMLPPELLKLIADDLDCA